MKRSEGRHWLSSHRHPARRDGAIALASLLLPGLIALALDRRDHHLDGGTIAILVSMALGLPLIWLAWATYRGKPASQSGEARLPEVADQLAVVVGAQWESEAAVRRLNEPYPLPVSWVPAEAYLTDSWDSLITLARTGAGWPDLLPEGAWAYAPEYLARSGTGLADTLMQIPTGRLLVLGEPGAGKTMLMIRLVLDLLTRRTPGDPVPILASAASWDPSEQDLGAWLAAQLRADHPVLATTAPGRNGQTLAEALLANGLIMPIVDGLDEIPAWSLGQAISRINAAFRPSMKFVMTCRRRDYELAIQPLDGAEVRLRGTATIELEPLNAAAVRKYLRDDAGGPVTAARWDPVLDALGTEAAAALALSTPLMVSLARIIYNPRPQEQLGEPREPGELLSPQLVDRAAVEAHLFDTFIPAAYRDNYNERWAARTAEKWLEFIARTSGANLAPWKGNLFHSSDRPNDRFIVNPLLSGFAVGSVGAITGVVAGSDSVIRASLATSLAIGLGAVLAVIIAGLAARKRQNNRLERELWTESVHSGDYSPSNPRADLAKGRRADLLALLEYLLAFLLASFGPGSAAGLLAGARPGGFAGGLAGMLAGVLLANGIGLEDFLWVRYTIVRVSLALRRQLPWSLMAFLGDAHRRGVLRQVGTVYQFRHIELQRRLGTRPARLRQRI